MPAIRILPERTVNRIAAGEVIERPAAAVKELVENALDAGATRIAVALDGGGIDRIEVTDDGSGMDADELALAVQRHATSKLADDDLVRIATLGLPRRGAALDRRGGAAGHHLAPARRADTPRDPRRGRRGVARSRRPPAPPGTRVVVRDLFFATPARRKFLKHPRTEAEHAEAAVRRLALAAPGRGVPAGDATGGWLFDLPRAGPRRARRGAVRPGGGGGAAAGRGGARRAAPRRASPLAGGDARHRRRRRR